MGLQAGHKFCTQIYGQPLILRLAPPPPVIEMALRKILTTDPTITQTNVAAAIEADTSVQEAWSSLPNYPTNKAQRLIKATDWSSALRGGGDKAPIRLR